MKRTTVLALLGLACLTAMPNITHARYRDGMNLYQYVKSQPVQQVDPSGMLLPPMPPVVLDPMLPRPVPAPKPPSAARAARAALAQVHQKHVGYMYYESNGGWLTGLRFLIWDKLNPALWWLDENDFSFGSSKSAVALYYPILNDMKIPHNPGPYVVMHESIHAYNDWVDKHEGARENEGLAYAATGMAEKLELLQKVENGLNANEPDPQEIGHDWRTAWAHIDVVGNIGQYGGSHMFTITDADVRLVNTFLGFKISCHDIAVLYNAQAGTEKACVTFTCDRMGRGQLNQRDAKGRLLLGVVLELHEPFR